MVSLLLNNDENKLNDPKIKNFLTKAEENGKEFSFILFIL